VVTDYKGLQEAKAAGMDMGSIDQRRVRDGKSLFLGSEVVLVATEIASGIDSELYTKVVEGDKYILGKMGYRRSSSDKPSTCSYIYIRDIH
jgi:hypothetical protein